MQHKFRLNHLLLGLCISYMIMPTTIQAEIVSEEARTMELRKMLEKRIAEIEKNEKQHKKMMKEGRNRTVLCSSCHGKDGIANSPLAPNLAGQNPVYIVDQFERFGDGRRNDYLMSNLAKTFSIEDKIKIALYYADMQMRPSGDGNPALVGQGKEIYQRECTRCHGDDAKGQEGYARLAGQRADYVAKMLKEFRDRTGRRTNPWMSGVAIRLSNSDMDAVASYLSHLQ